MTRGTMRSMACILAAAGAMASAAEIPQVERLFDEASAWDTAPGAAAKRWMPLGFRWMDAARTDLRWFEPRQAFLQHGHLATNLEGRLPDIQVLGERPIEVVLRFRDDRLAGLSTVFYSRGDSGDTHVTNLLALARTVAGRLDAWTGAKGFVQRGDRRGEGAAVDRMIWVRGGVRLDLEWSSTRLSATETRPEFVRLQASKYDPSDQARLMGGRAAEEAVGGASGSPASAQQMKQRVEVRANGDRVVPVPMVDQGPKGYCVAAVLERVARFYGREFDQHDAAQLAGTSAEGGTTSGRLVEALRTMAGLMKMRCTGRTDMDETTSFLHKDRHAGLQVPKDLADTLKDYNKEAKRAGKPEVDIWQAFDSGDVGDVYRRFDKDIFRKVRLARRVDAEKFHRDVARTVDAGVPVVWSVLVGIVAEPKLPGDGEVSGHMRMIVGYNATTREILYSDTWGAGHEEKRMAMDDAWVITKGTFVVTPPNVRL
ncbi:MAG: hypothetical protein FJ221_17025 [Lentisphaerae bacterium]|nr:hypothetical protein [Lentisphaerota bacterium]